MVVNNLSYRSTKKPNLIALSLFFFLKLSQQFNDFPVIGIFAQPRTGIRQQYIAASYVKWVESAGGRVVPISYNASVKEVDYLIDNLNGFLLPGGEAPISSTIKYLFNRVVEENNKGVFTPLWGTCLGFEWILCSATGDDSILDIGFNSRNISLPVSFTKYAADSQIFSDAPHFVIDAYSKQPIAFHNHGKGIKLSSFFGNALLPHSFRVVSTNKDLNGVSFVSSFESSKLPIFAVMWHPEKSAFEWGTYEDGTPFEAIAHSPEAVACSQYLADFFVGQCRRNPNSFGSPAELHRMLIYNFNAKYGGPEFVQSYYFNF